MLLNAEATIRRSPEISPMPSPNLSTSHNVIPTSTLPTTPLLPARPPSPERMLSRPLESSPFLTALAAQERRVLELREELQRAESDLEKLKRHWALHEMSKKKNEIRHLEQLRSISKSVSSTTPLSPNSLASSRPFHERRKSLAINTKQPQRKVFSGSRHTRTLSLLSPKSALDSDPDTAASGIGKIPNGISRADTASENPSTTIANRASTTTVFNKRLSGPPKDAILETGKQLVGDFREGLWTFFEDLRQATVGEEATGSLDSRATSSARNPPASRNEDSSQHRDDGIADPVSKPKAKNTRSHQTASNSQDNITNEMGGAPEKEKFLHKAVDPVSEECNPSPSSTKPKPGSTPHQQQPDANPNESDDDGWDNWDSPKPAKHSLSRWSTSTNSPSDRAATEKSSPRTSISSSDVPPLPHRSTPKSTNPSLFGKTREDIPWPALTKLSPGNLKRTASTLISEWERSLTPAESADELSSGGGEGGGGGLFFSPTPLTPVKEKKAD